MEMTERAERHFLGFLSVKTRELIAIVRAETYFMLSEIGGGVNVMKQNRIVRFFFCENCFENTNDLSPLGKRAFSMHIGLFDFC